MREARRLIDTGVLCPHCNTKSIVFASCVPLQDQIRGISTGPIASEPRNYLECKSCKRRFLLSDLAKLKRPRRANR
jgi:DNA-directed RNA polymerase subunit RPC12/RpoP